jgi:DegV family protein with EDD domain
MNYKIVSDSSSNLFTLPGVSYATVPLKIITKTQEYVDAPGLDIDAMMAQLHEYDGRSSTSCPNVAEWLDAFEGADGVFALTITGQLSGSYSAACQAKADYEAAHPGARVHVIDSLSAGPELQLLLERLRELVLSGADFDGICQGITAYQQKTRLVFMLESLKNLANNGRCSHAVATVAGLLGIRLVGQASEQGTLQPLHKARGQKKALKEIFSEMEKNGYAGGRVRIAQCQNQPGAQELKELILGHFAQADVQIVPCAGLCSYYAEQGGLMIGYDTP